MIGVIIFMSVAVFSQAGSRKRAVRSPKGKNRKLEKKKRKRRKK